MDMFPSYKLRDVLNMYAVSFYTLLQEGYRLKATNERRLLNLLLAPHMEPSERSKFIRNLEWASQEPDDILGLNDSATGTIEDAKRIIK